MRHFPNLTARARSLRIDDNPAQAALWRRLRNRHLGVKFRRQEQIGPFIADFVCFERRLVIEVDGGQHAEEENVRKDQERTLWLQSQGFTVLRFWNNEVLTQTDAVCEAILATLSSSSPSP